MVLEECKLEMKKSMSPENQQASKASVTIYIFHPGGDLSCLQDVLLCVSTGTPKLQQLSLYLSREMTYALKEKESTVAESSSSIHENTKWRSARLTMRTWFIFKEGDMSGTACLSCSTC